MFCAGSWGYQDNQFLTLGLPPNSLVSFLSPPALNPVLLSHKRSQGPVQTLQVSCLHSVHIFCLLTLFGPQVHTEAFVGLGSRLRAIGKEVPHPQVPRASWSREQAQILHGHIFLALRSPHFYLVDKDGYRKVRGEKQFYLHGNGREVWGSGGHSGVYRMVLLPVQTPHGCDGDSGPHWLKGNELIFLTGWFIHTLSPKLCGSYTPCICP